GGGRAARTGGDPLGTSYTDLSRPFGTIAEDPVMVVAQAGVAPGAARVNRVAYGEVPGRGPGPRPPWGASREDRACASSRHSTRSSSAWSRPRPRPTSGRYRSSTPRPRRRAR